MVLSVGRDEDPTVRRQEEREPVRGQDALESGRRRRRHVHHVHAAGCPGEVHAGADENGIRPHGVGQVDTPDQLRSGGRGEVELPKSALVLEDSFPPLRSITGEIPVEIVPTAIGARGFATSTTSTRWSSAT